MLLSLRAVLKYTLLHNVASTGHGICVKLVLRH